MVLDFKFNTLDEEHSSLKSFIYSFHLKILSLTKVPKVNLVLLASMIQLFPKGLPRSDIGIQLLQKPNQPNVPLPRKTKKKNPTNKNQPTKKTKKKPNKKTLPQHQTVHYV